MKCADGGFSLVKLLLALVIVPALKCAAQPAANAPAVTSPATQPAADLVALNFPDNVLLKVIVDYMSQRLDLNILYEEQFVNQKITLRSPAKIPASALPGLLESILKTKGLMLVDAEQPGWKRIVPIALGAQPTTMPAGEAGPTLVVTQVFRLEHADPKAVDPVIKPFLSQPGGSSFAIPEQRVLVVSDFASDVERLAELIRLIDRPSRDVAIEFIPVKHADASAASERLKHLLTAKLRSEQGTAQAAEQVEVAHDPRSNQIVVIGTRDLAAHAARIVRSLDVPITEEQSPVRFYKLANATAVDVLATIRALEGRGGAQSSETGGTPASRRGESLASPRRPAGALPASEVAPGGASIGGVVGSRPPSLDQPSPGTTTATVNPAANPTASLGDVQGEVDIAAATSDEAWSAEGIAAEGSSQAVQTRQAKVAADANTNTIIVIAEPAVQRLYEQLIRTLDKRRPQVLIEATIVTVDTRDGFSLGVELSANVADSDEDPRLITFSSFGLSTVDPDTGRLSLLPGAGFNGALISADIADVVLRALATNNRAKVVSAPRILVNDNATGTLMSLAEAPFSSLNASDTVATTSFAGYAEAGTTIVVTPHISESDYLQLEYEVSLSSFTGPGTNRLPPPRQTDSVQSKITVPDGSTIVVGGLNRRNFNERVTSVPLLGKIPVLEHLFSSRDRNDSSTTLFLFIRPIILRDDQFEDLKFLSARDLEDASVPGDFPDSNPMTMR